MGEVQFVDTTFRDGHASLWAEGMTTDMMLPVAEAMDAAGFAHMEVIATSHFKKCILELGEDPWQRIRLLAKHITKTPLTLMMGHNVTAFDLTPFSVVRLFLERVAAAGINRVEMMDAANDMSFRIPQCVRFCREFGMQVSLPLIYCRSSKHTDEYYAQRTRNAAKLKPDTIYLKDSGGLLTPERTPSLMKAVLEAAGDIPVELHSHCTTGLAPLCYLEAVKAGVRTLHTAIPPLANGASQPSLFNVAKNLRAMKYKLAVNDKDLLPVSQHFEYIAKHEGLPIGVPVEYDEHQYIHQVPGGVISNLKHQLTNMRMEHRLEDVLMEIVQVKQDLGYPIMVTPFSQFVASQAAMNILTGERYKQVTDEVIMYTLGFWGEEASAAVDPNVADRILNRPRAKELADWRLPDLSIEELRQKLGGSSLSDDQLILRFVAGQDTATKAAAPRREHVVSGNPLVGFVHTLLKKEMDSLYVQNGDFLLNLRK